MTDSVDFELANPPTPRDLTIAICTIGRDGYLQAAIQSLIETTPSGVRLHLVLNGPTDLDLRHRLTDFTDRWDGPSEITVLDERLTIAGSHNTALDAATTRFITFMGDDDLALEPRVEQLLDLFWTTTPTPAVIGSYCRRVSGTHDEPRFSTNKDYGPSSLEEWEAQRDAGDLIELVFPSAIYRTELLRSVGGFEERFGSAMDLATFTILAQDHPVIADPRRSFAHRIHDGSVTSSSAGSHAARLRYTEACIAAVRNGTPQPAWASFVTSEKGTSPQTRASEGRHTMSATLFRQGGAAVSSGQRVHGMSKIAASAVVSPSTFLGRLRSQVTRESNAEPVVSLLLCETTPEQFGFFELLRGELRSRGIELRLVVACTGNDDTGAPARLPWAEHRSPRTFDLVKRTLVWQPGFDIATTSELIITEYGSRQLFNTVLALGQSTLRTRHCFWGDQAQSSSVGDEQLPRAYLRRLTAKAHWLFACTAGMANAAAACGMAPDRITTLQSATLEDSPTMAARFADGVAAALDAPPR